MENNNYENWDPIVDLPSDFYFYELNDSKGILTVLLKEPDPSTRILRIQFNGNLGYRLVDETGRIKTLGDPTLINFAISRDSEFLRWFKEESMGVFGDWPLMHFVICNSDNIIDVISSKYPIVEWV